MGFFTRRTEQPSAFQPPSSTPVDLGSALELVLVKSVESQATLATKMSEMMIGQMDSLTTLFAKRLGSRGGKKSAEGRKRNKDGTFKTRRMSQCRLCDNPAVLDPQPEEIRAHINHQNPGLNYRVENGAVHADADEASIVKDKEGNEFIECESCAKGIEHSHTIN